MNSSGENEAGNRSSTLRGRRFIADSMLGKLSRWLNIAGLDVIYSKERNKALIIKLALEQDRIILTRDTSLRGKNVFFIVSENFREQIRQVLASFPLPRPENFCSRCILCNSPLESIEKELIKNRLPPYVYENHQEFSHCPLCNRIYWAGSHFLNMKRELEAIITNRKII